jgi:hypothetical protein
MRRFLLAAALTLAVSPAVAAGPAKKASPEGGHVDVAPFAVPVMIEGRVVNYVFVSVRLQVAPSADPQGLLSKEPRVREALVRASHRTPMNPPGQRSSVDESRLAKVALAEAKRIGGAAFIGAEVRKQTPQRQLAPLERPG